MCVCVYVCVCVQLTLEQDGFEPHGSTYTWIFKQIVNTAGSAVG